MSPPTDTPTSDGSVQLSRVGEAVGIDGQVHVTTGRVHHLDTVLNLVCNVVRDQTL